MRFAIITSGPISSDAISRIREDDVIFAADGGADLCAKNGLVPDRAYGDFDSCSPDGMAFLKEHEVRTETFPIEKDWTDTEICLKNIPGGSDVLIICPITGGRIDHVIANIQLAAGFLSSMNSITLSDGGTDIYVMEGEMSITCDVKRFKNASVSLVPLDYSVPVKGITGKGLYYPLNDIDAVAGKTLTFSNHPVSGTDEISVSIRSGRLAVIVTNNV